MVRRPFRARFFVATFFCKSRQVVWKGATASVPPKGCKKQVRALHSRPHVVWGGTISLSRWCERQMGWGAQVLAFSRARIVPKATSKR